METDEIKIETAEVKDQDDEMLWENPTETDIDAVMETDMNTGNSCLIMKQRAVANKLHFPFDNEDTSCFSNTRQIEEESVTFPYKVGYGYRITAWYIINNNYRNLPTSDELQSEEYTGNKYNIDQSINEDIEQIINADEEQFADDPKKVLKH